MNTSNNHKTNVTRKSICILLLVGLIIGVVLPLNYFEFSDVTLLTAPVGYEESVLRQLTGGFIVLTLDFIVLGNISIHVKDLVNELSRRRVRSKSHG